MLLVPAKGVTQGKTPLLLLRSNGVVKGRRGFQPIAAALACSSTPPLPARSSCNWVSR
jgi:hypothetical protein